jgi:uracil-DNA glycosylase
MIPGDWRAVLVDALADPAMASLEAFVAREREEFDVFPPPGDVFAALRLTPFATVRAVILGQDPYHRPGQACGLAFAVPDGIPAPPSLLNIRAELGRDLDKPRPAEGPLETWARHGVLLLNTVLTVRCCVAHSHANQGWERLTEAIVAAVAAKPEPVAFLLWGTSAQAYRRCIDEARHVVVTSTHPSPLSARRASRGGPSFIGSAPFRHANEALAKRDQPPIDWDLTRP